MVATPSCRCRWLAQPCFTSNPAQPPLLVHRRHNWHPQRCRQRMGRARLRRLRQPAPRRPSFAQPRHRSARRLRGYALSHHPVAAGRSSTPSPMRMSTSTTRTTVRHLLQLRQRQLPSGPRHVRQLQTQRCPVAVRLLEAQPAVAAGKAPRLPLRSRLQQPRRQRPRRQDRRRRVQPGGLLQCGPPAAARPSRRRPPSPPPQLVAVLQRSSPAPHSRRS